jgi:flagellar basal-body rod modification protein FlgD
MNEINGFKVSDSVFEQLSFKQEVEKKKSDDSLGQADFLKLLITQLENQDPLSPQDNSAFVAQLAQFSTLQGIENLNSNFVSMNSNLKSSQAIQASALVGHTVFVNASTARLTGTGEIFGSIEVAKPVDDTLLNVYDSRGLLVRQEVLGAQDPGDIRFGWDGRNNAGESLPPGVYRFEALGLREGNTVGLPTTLSANVNSVTIGVGGEMTLNVDGVGPLKISEVKEIL